MANSVRVTISRPAGVHLEGEPTVHPGGFSYSPRFLRDSIRRTGANHEGPTVTVQVVDGTGAVVRTVQAVTLLVTDDGSIRLLQETPVAPAFLQQEEEAKP
jgi:hypothetical protein